MMIRSHYKFLFAVPVALWLTGCVAPSPYANAPVVDGTAMRPLPPPPPPSPPPVQVNPLPRPEPLLPQPQNTGPLVPYQPPEGVVTAPPQNIPPPAPVEIAPQGNQAVAALLDSASQYVNAGELDRAAAALERALRIEPKNAGIWHDLAQIRLHQRKYQEAESMATKSNSLTNDRSLKIRNWQLIAVSRRAVGNDVGADEAEAQVVVLRSS